MENQHMQNFIECVRAAGPGWEIVEEDSFTAVKSPVRDPIGNCIWARAGSEAIARSKAFFGDHAFTWALEEGQDGAPLQAAGFKVPEAVPDLVLNLDRYTCPGYRRGIRVARADSNEDFPFWAATAGEALGLCGGAVRAFFLPLVQGGAVPFLAYHEGLPAATALAYCAEETLGVYAVGTRPVYRRMGLGRAVTDACLNLGQEMGRHHAVLSSSAMGRALYRKIGFQTARVVSEYQFRQ
jgi:ribosomal protein S18 acetylase RimI-like enzyme